jgi:hypothetical protein
MTNAIVSFEIGGRDVSSRESAWQAYHFFSNWKEGLPRGDKGRDVAEDLRKMSLAAADFFLLREREQE